MPSTVIANIARTAGSRHSDSRCSAVVTPVPRSHRAAAYGQRMDSSPSIPATTSIVVMGVSGSGKTSAAQELTRQLGWVYIEGDDLHPEANVAKMASGIPLDDEDRWPWLQRIAEVIGEHEAAGTSIVVTCSALKRTYRDLLREGHPSVWFAHVDVPREVLAERLRNRTGHYMPPSLLDSQLATLERLGDDEPGDVIAGNGPLEQTVAELLTDLRKERQLS
jgi:gluconokinase